MKKMCVMLCLLLGLRISGCAQPGPSYVEPDYTEVPVTGGSSRSDEDKISVQAGALYVTEEQTTLVVVWHNQTEDPAQYGDGAYLERMENGNWVTVIWLEGVSDAITGALDPGDLDNKVYVSADGFDYDRSRHLSPLRLLHAEPGGYRADTVSGMGGIYRGIRQDRNGRQNQKIRRLWSTDFLAPPARLELTTSRLGVWCTEIRTTRK